MADDCALVPARVRVMEGHTPWSAGPDTQVVFIVDDDRVIRELMREVLERDGRSVQDFASAEAFLNAYRPGSTGCLLIDVCMPGMDGLTLLHHLRGVGERLPAIMITGSGDVPIAIAAMKAGAMDFIEKPIGVADFLARIGDALVRSRDISELVEARRNAAQHVGRLTLRQHQIMDRVLAGHPSKNIAADLGISQRTVENHRAEIMKRTEVHSLPELARLAVAATAKSLIGR